MIHVYVGPTLGRAEPVLATPRIRVLQPVRHGDLFDPAIVSEDTVVVIDGAWHQAPAVRHKELVGLLDRGVRVIGAASVGALRAAELHRFGMTGVGRVFRAYRRGEIDGDDEVAVGQAPDGDLRALTWPLVNVRQAFRLAVGERVVTREAAAALLEAARAVYYPQRTVAAVLAVCRRRGARTLAAWLEEHKAADPFFADVKRDDALEAVQVALAGPLPLWRSTTGAGESGYFRRWGNAFATQNVDGVLLHTAQRVAYQQLFDPVFPQVWSGFLDHLSRHPGDGTRGMPLAERIRSVAPEGAPPAHVLFRPQPDLRDSGTVARLLERETAADRAAITRYTACNDTARRAQAGFCPQAVDEDTTRRVLLRLWDIAPARLEEAAASRGFRSSAHATEELKVFMAGLVHDQEQTRKLTDAR
ncbi:MULTISPECIES: TfuA-like protein [unclassified Streptomyces]|uniref:TfuA-like protein n=1 Tax=Streptomyces sp. NBC_00060 TaxID=2975636 RepID=A0AAU2HFI5_9ACTN